MPLIPGVNQTAVKANAANTPYFSVKATDEAFGGNIAKSMLSLGKDLGGDADIVAKLRPKKKEDQTTDATKAGQKVPQEKAGDQDGEGGGPAAPADISKAIDLLIGFKGNAFSLQRDFFRLDGKAAVEAAPDALDRLAQLQSDTVAAATSPASVSLAQSAVISWGRILTDNIKRHAVAQQQVYDQDLDETQIAQSRDAVGLLYNDDRNFLLHLQVAAEARADQVVRQTIAGGGKTGGDTAATVADARAAVASDLVSTRIGAALDQGDTAGAMALHGRWQGDLLAKDRGPIEQMLAASRFTERVDAETNRILAVGR